MSKPDVLTDYYKIDTYWFKKRDRTDADPVKTVTLTVVNKEGRSATVLSAISYSNDALGFDKAGGFPFDAWAHYNNGKQTISEYRGVPREAIMEFFLMLLEYEPSDVDREIGAYHGPRHYVTHPLDPKPETPPEF